MGLIELNEEGEFPNYSLYKYPYTIPAWPEKEGEYIRLWELYNSGKKKIRFFEEFKEDFCKGISYDVGENNNYVHCLYYSILEEYDEDRSPEELAKYLYQLIICYPCVRSGAVFYLRRIYKNRTGRKELFEFLVKRFPEFEKWEYGEKISHKFSLAEGEIDRFNSIYRNFKLLHNDFCTNEFNILYLYVLRTYTLNQLEEDIIKIVAYEQPIEEYNYKVSLYDLVYKTCSEFTHDFYSKRKRNLKLLDYFRESSRPYIHEVLLSKIYDILSGYDSFKPLPEEEKIKMNEFYPDIWRDEFDLIPDITSVEKSNELFEQIKFLYNKYQKSPNIDDMLYKTVKMFYKYDPRRALSLYFQYISHHYKLNRTKKIKSLLVYVHNYILSSHNRKEKFNVLLDRFKKKQRTIRY